MRCQQALLAVQAEQVVQVVLGLWQQQLHTQAGDARGFAGLQAANNSTPGDSRCSLQA
jgi:hypothetical protein